MKKNIKKIKIKIIFKVIIFLMNIYTFIYGIISKLDIELRMLLCFGSYLSFIFIIQLIINDLSDLRQITGGLNNE